MKTAQKSWWHLDSIIVFLSILFTIISQTPTLVENGIGKFLLLMWILPVFRIVILKKIGSIKTFLFPFFAYLILFVFLVTLEGLTGREYISLPNFSNLTMMFSMMIIGYFSGLILSEKDLINILFFASMVGGVLLCLSIYFFSFNDGYDLTTREYGYLSKNSAAQIIFSCIVFGSLLPINSSFKAIKNIFLIFMVYIIFILKSRATIIAFCLFFFFVIFKSKNKKLQFILILGLLLVLITLKFSQSFYVIFIDGILAGGRDLSDIDDVSSGRIEMYSLFPSLFQEQIFFGRGYYFIESFPLATIIQVGLVGTIIIFSFLLWVVSVFRSRLNINNSFDLCVIIIFYSYILNSLFEEQSPFGPGAKCFLFWLPFGFILSKRCK